MRRVLPIIAVFIIMMFISFFVFYYYATASDGIKMGKLVTMEHKGMLFKSWEGTLIEGDSNDKVFTFSVLDSDKRVVDSLNALQGQYIKVNYIERYRSMPWWGENHYFVVNAEKSVSPFNTSAP